IGVARSVGECLDTRDVDTDVIALDRDARCLGAAISPRGLREDPRDVVSGYDVSGGRARPTYQPISEINKNADLCVTIICSGRQSLDLGAHIFSFYNGRDMRICAAVYVDANAETVDREPPYNARSTWAAEFQTRTQVLVMIVFSIQLNNRKPGKSRLSCGVDGHWNVDRRQVGERRNCKGRRAWYIKIDLGGGSRRVVRKIYG